MGDSSYCVCFLFLVPEVHRAPDVLLEHSVPSSCLVPSDSFILSGDNVATAIQTGKSVINPALPEVQVNSQFLSFRAGTQCIKYQCLVFPVHV